MLEYRLEPEGGLLVCALGTLEVGGGQIVECSLCLSDILPERRVQRAGFPWSECQVRKLATSHCTN